MEPKSNSSKSSSSQCSLSTAPSYSVIERSDGKLVNDRLGVVWPEKPKKRVKEKERDLITDFPGTPCSSKGSKTREEYGKSLKNDKLTEEATVIPHPYFEHVQDKIPQTENIVIQENHHSTEMEYAMQKYWGPATITKLETNLEVGEFALFYPIMEGSDCDCPPFDISLTLAYKTSNKKLLSFPIDRDRNGQWSVVIKGTEKPQFDTIAQMIKYYSIHAYINPDTSEVETFPVWENEKEEDKSHDLTSNRENNSDTYEILFNDQ